MMIRQLEKETVQLLSCSQVITSVHSAVKELVENALDANATSIAVRLENYGLDLIEVKDDGKGVKQEDVAAMVCAHSTSKISSFQNLNSLQTYGFRGEALHSLSKMGCVKVITRTASDSLARAYEFTSTGEVGVARVCPDDPGTTVSVTGLFRSVPVRRQYYKNMRRCKESLKSVEEYLLAFALAHPGVRFQLRHNSHTLMQKPQVANFEDNAANILGVECFQRLAPLNYQCFDPMLKIKALLPSPRAQLDSSSTRSSSDRLFVLVNKRPVVLKPVAQLVKQAFAATFPSLSSRYPVAVVLLNVLPQALDVNLDPNKKIVLLHDLVFITDTFQSLLEQLYSVCKVLPTNSRCEEVPKPRCVSDEEDGDCSPQLQVSIGTEDHRNRCLTEGSHQRGGCHVVRTRQGANSTLLSNGRQERVSESRPRSEVCSPQNGCASREEGIPQVLCSEEEHRKSSRDRGTGESSAIECQSRRSLLQSENERETDASTSDFYLVGSRMASSSEDTAVGSRMASSSEDTAVGSRIASSSEDTATAKLPTTRCAELQKDMEDIWNDVISPELLEEMENEDLLVGDHPSGQTGQCVCVAAEDVATLATESGGSTRMQQVTLSQWSRGNSRLLSDQPAQLCSPPAPTSITTSPTCTKTPPTISNTPLTSAARTLSTKSRTPISKLTQKRPAPVYDLVNSVPVKRRGTSSTALAIASTNQTTLGTTPTSKESHPLQVPHYCTAASSTNFDLKAIEKRLSMVRSYSHSALVESSCVVGYCGLSEDQSPGVWLVRCGCSLACFNVKRAQKDVCFTGDVTNKSEVARLLSACMKTDNGSAYLHIIHELHEELCL